jgi:hypothetical protein
MSISISTSANCLDNSRRRMGWVFWLISAAVSAFVIFASFQASHDDHTSFTSGAYSVSKLISSGSVVRIGWNPHLDAVTVTGKTAESLVIADGTKIPFKDISFIRKGERVSVADAQWMSENDPISKISTWVVEGETIHVMRKVAPEFVAVVKEKREDGFSTEDGRFVHYKDVGYVITRTPFIEAFPKVVWHDIVIVPIFISWVLTDFLSVVFHIN